VLPSSALTEARSGRTCSFDRPSPANKPTRGPEHGEHADDVLLEVDLA
jgi:hypothetical protein